MIDFYGATSSGKTLYLYAIIIATVLPKSWKYSKSKPPIPLSGKARSVVFVDMDQGFSAQRLKTLLCLEIVSRINDWNERQTMKEQETDEKPNPDRDTSESDPASHRDYVDPGTLEMQAKIEQLAMSCLRNVHVFRPPDAISTIVMLRTLDQYFMNLSSDPMMIAAAAASITAGIKPGSTSRGAGRAGGTYSNPPFALLILDSLSSFFWQERAHANHTRFMTLLVEALNRLAKWKLVYISTTWNLPSSFSTTDRTVTDRLRERFKYRFQMQPRTLERFDTEEKLLYEWSRRRGRRQAYQRGTGESSALGEWQGNNKALSTTSVEDTGSLFQVQMVHPSVEHPRQQVFRFSISNTRGIHSFSVPSLS